MCYVLFMIVLLAYDSCDSLDGYPSFPPLLVQEAPILLGFYCLIFKLNIIRDTFKWGISLRMTWYIKKSHPNHRKKIPTITIIGILHTFVGMDINIWPTYPENLCPNFFSEKVWLRNTLPTCSLDICPIFRSFIFLQASLIEDCNLSVPNELGQAQV